jgi:hypothetical protein
LIFAVGQHAVAHAAAWYNRRLPETPSVTGIRPYRIAATEPLPTVGRWATLRSMAEIAGGSPQGTVVALSEHGLVGAAAREVFLIDMVGLHDRQFALEGFSAEEMFRRKPDLIWLPHYNYPLLVQDVLEQDELWEEYVYYPGAFHFGIAIRKRSPHSGRLAELFAREWKAVYGNLRPEDYVAAVVE